MFLIRKNDHSREEVRQGADGANWRTPNREKSRIFLSIFPGRPGNGAGGEEKPKTRVGNAPRMVLSLLF